MSVGPLQNVHFLVNFGQNVSENTRLIQVATKFFLEGTLYLVFDLVKSEIRLIEPGLVRRQIR